MLIGTLVANFIGPWWSSSVVILVIAAYLNLKTTSGMLLGSLSLGIVFLFMALYQYSLDKADILSKTGFMLGGLSSTDLLCISTLIGLITGLVSGWIGSSFGDILRKS
jgi:hypothetical protein